LLRLDFIGQAAAVKIEAHLLEPHDQEKNLAGLSRSACWSKNIL
jgi:hypothetical protein